MTTAAVGDKRLCPRCHTLGLTVVHHHPGDPDHEDPKMREPITGWRCECGHGEYI